MWIHVRMATAALLVSALVAGCLSEPTEPTENEPTQASTTEIDASRFPSDAWPAGYHLCTPGPAIEHELGMQTNPGPVEKMSMFDSSPPDELTGTILVRDGPEECEANPHGVLIKEGRWNDAQDHQAFRNDFEASMPATQDWLLCTQFQVLHGDQESVIIQAIHLDGPTSDSNVRTTQPAAMMYDLMRTSVAYENANGDLEPYCP